ncbi:MAG: hypothetical protein HUK14_05705 [Muribaculaceae bacterium]|nr:hypothetical protein [Muribaculaceae bacterium]
MKLRYTLKTIAAALGLLVIGQTFSSCDNKFDYPPVIVPLATKTPNATIAEVKARYWDDAKNYIDTIGLNEEGEHIVISGRVISADTEGNIYKSLVIQDETAALAISINNSSLSSTYRIGQEIVLDVTDMYIGKYNGLQQLGFPEWYEAGSAWEATFMTTEFFEAHREINGLPEPAKVDTILTNFATINAATSADDLQRWQSQLVRFDDVKWEEGGIATFSEKGSSTNRTLVDKDGNKLIVRNSNYATFAGKVLPTEYGSVVGILSYYGSSGWQLLLRDTNDCIGFKWTEEKPEEVDPKGSGTLDDPYNVARALQITESGQASEDKVYVEGTIVLIDNIDTSYGNATYYINDGGASRKLEIYRGYGLNNKKFTTGNEIKVGDKVVIYGTLVLFRETTPEMTTGNYIVKLNGGTEPEPEPEPVGDKAKFEKVSDITSGGKYVFVYDGKVGTAISETYTYGRLALKAVTITDNVLETEAANALTITKEGDGYYIKDSFGRYFSIASGYLTNFQLPTTPGGGGATSLWKGTPNNGTVEFTLEMDGTTIAIAQSGTFTNIAPTDIGKYTPNYPDIYKMKE